MLSNDKRRKSQFKQGFGAGSFAAGAGPSENKVFNTTLKKSRIGGVTNSMVEGVL